MAFTLTSNLVTISECDVDNWDGGAGFLEEDFYKEPTGCLGIDTDIETNRMYYTVVPDWTLNTGYSLGDFVKPTALNSYVYECTTAGTSAGVEPSPWNTTPDGTTNDNTVVWTTRENTWTGRHFYAWLMCLTAGFLDTKTNGGMQLILVDASGNEGYWHVGGSDTYPGGWRRFICSADSIPDANSGTDPSPNIITVGVGFKGVIKSKLAQNTFWDYVQYDTSASRGVKITGGVPDDWDAVLTQDEAAYVGLIRKEAGVFFLQGTFQFGDAATDVNVADTNQVLVFEDIAASSDFHKITIVGNVAGTSNFKLGTKSGTAGISGCVIKSAGDPKFQIDATDTNIDILGLYGCTLFDAGTISLPVYSSTRELLNCNIEASAELLADTCTVTNCNFLNADDRGIRISSTSHNITNSNFISCPHAIHINAADTYTFSGLIFTNNTYDVENSTAGVVNINVSGAGAASSAENTGGGSTNFISSVDVDAKVLDVSGSNVEYAQVYIQKSDTGKQWNYLSDTTNAQGDIEFVVKETVDSDLPAGGWLHVWDRDANTKQNYRYASWATKTFTLKSKIGPIACTGGGTSTSLQDDTTSDFTTIEIVEGDTVRNETDGSWAVVDEITDADNITTTPLQGGSDNTWTSGDDYSFHNLAIAYSGAVGSEDRIDIPLYNGQTDSNGEISTSYNYGEIGNPAGQSGYTSLPVRIRIRSNQDATKYIPYNTSGTITGSGYNLTAVLTEDEVAT